ncbi:MAG: zinc-ribbon domain-containing protein [Pyrinomonadaceae bacterium]
MFCPKCGTKNPEEGKFCRKCGSDLARLSRAMSGEDFDYMGDSEDYEKDNSGCSKNKDSHEVAYTKLFMGIAFLAVSAVLGITNNVVGRGWWFWMLIPGFMFVGIGLAGLSRIRAKRFDAVEASNSRKIEGTRDREALPQVSTEFVSPSSRYETGDLVPPSVVENTTKNLQMDKEAETMYLNADQTN